MKTALQIANKFIEIGCEQQPSQSYTPMQLLKLVYIAHGWMLAIYNRPLICEEVEAWMYGPVIPDLYQAVKHYRSNPVRSYIQLDDKADASEFDSDELNIIQYVISAYGHIDGISLSQITHANGTPWSLTYNNVDWGTVISNNLISHHYKGLLADLKNRAQPPVC